MLKSIFFAGVLLSGTAFAQQVDVSGKDFLSGAGDAQLAHIASQAAAEGKTLVVTAPPYWQAKIGAKLHAGAANVDVRMSDGFFENVLVRVEDSKPAAAKADAVAADSARAESTKVNAAKAEAAARAEAAKAQAARAEADKADAARAEAAQSAAAQAEAARAKAVQAEAAKAEAARAAAQAAAEKAEAAKAEAAKVAASKAAADSTAAIQQRMQKNLNDGNPADGSLTVAQLQAGDMLFVDGSVRGIVRREGARAHLYWLQGDLNLDRAELTPTGNDRYSVNQPVRDIANPPLRTRAGGHFVGNVPPPGSAERTSLQEHYADGRDVSASLRPTDLRTGDIVYMGKSSAIVLRRSGTELVRYWLDGDLNLGQSGLLKQGDSAYRVLSDTVK